MTDLSHYIIRGGDAGAQRLRVLSRAMHAPTLDLLNRAGLSTGMHVLDLGCGSGDVTIEISRLVGPAGSVVGIDIDNRVLTHALSLSETSGDPVQWRQERAEDLKEEDTFDMVYARFLLSHLPDPADVLEKMRRAVRPSGQVIVEDIDITAHVYWPQSAAFHRYIELYTETARTRGVDPSIGPRLVSLLTNAGLTDVEVSISMPVFRAGEGKSIARLTLLNIAEAAIAEGLTDHAEIDRLLVELTTHETDHQSIQSTAQVFQVIGRHQ